MCAFHIYPEILLSFISSKTMDKVAPLTLGKHNFFRSFARAVFFEFIQRKDDEGVGEGNFLALFELVARNLIN